MGPPQWHPPIELSNEDTYNLLGHALGKALKVIARSSQRDLGSVAVEAGVEIVAASSLKAALDLDWDDPVAKAQALATILQALEQVESLVTEQQELDEATVTEVKEHLHIGRQVQAQDVEETADGSPRLRKGVALIPPHFN